MFSVEGIWLGYYRVKQSFAPCLTTAVAVRAMTS